MSKLNLFDNDSLFFLLAFSFGLLGISNHSFMVIDDESKVMLTILAFILLLGFMLKHLFTFYESLIKWVALVGIISVFVLIPTIISINLRHETSPFLFVHDNPLQVEEAIKFFLKGENPYGQNYQDTAMGSWPYYHPGSIDLKGTPAPEELRHNPALFHLVSLPFGFLAPLPFFLVFNGVFAFFDARIFYLICYLLLLPVAALVVDKKWRFSLVALLSLNPFFAKYLVEGHNDVLVLMLLVLVILLISRGKLLASAIPLGLAIATKQTAWIFFIVFLVYILYGRKSKPKELLVLISVMVITAGILILPFFLWNPSAFIADTISYVSAGGAANYPISGWGFAMLLFLLEIIPTTISFYPGFIFQLIFGGLGIFFIARLFKKAPSLSNFIFCFALFLFAMMFFSRFFFDSYFGVVLQFLFLGYFIAESTNLNHKV